MKIVAVTNIKGGVGKTTTAVNLAFLSAAGGNKTLLWDLDPQGAATYILQCEANERASAKKLVAGKLELPELLVASGYEHLDVLPSDFSYRKFDVHLNNRKRPVERLLKMSRSLRGEYAALFLDCPPGISLLSENVLRAADAVVVPLLPRFKLLLPVKVSGVPVRNDRIPVTCQPPTILPARLCAINRLPGPKGRR